MAGSFLFRGLLQHPHQLLLDLVVQTDPLAEVAQVVPVVFRTASETLEGAVLGFLLIRLGGFQLNRLVLQQILGEDHSVVIAADPRGLGLVLYVGWLHYAQLYCKQLNHSGGFSVRVKVVTDLVVAAEL